jgi:hypothetical protein
MIIALYPIIEQVPGHKEAQYATTNSFTPEAKWAKRPAHH